MAVPQRSSLKKKKSQYWKPDVMHFLNVLLTLSRFFMGNNHNLCKFIHVYLHKSMNLFILHMYKL